MNFIFLANGLLTLGLCIFLIARLIHFRKNNELSKILANFLVIGFCYLLISVLSFLWFFRVLGYSSSDFSFLYAFILFLQNFLLFRTVYLLSGNKKLNYFLGLYVLSLPLVIFFGGNSIVLFFVVSFLFLLLVFVDLAFRSDEYRKVGYAGIVYSVMSFFLSMLLFINLEFISWVSLISFVIFSYLVYLFLSDLDKYPISGVDFSKKSYVMNFLGHLIFIIAIVNFVFIGTIGIHEFGHFGTSKFFDCGYQKIVYEGDFFHTEVLCASDFSNLFVTLGGVLLPLFVAFLLFVLGDKFMKKISFLVAGFNLISLSKDLKFIGLSNNIILFSIFAGVIFLVWGIFSLAKSRVEEEIYGG